MHRKRKQNKDGLSNQTTKNSIKLTTKAARRKLEVPMPAAVPCKRPIKSSGETTRVVDADESTRPRLEGAGHKLHLDHVTAKRDEFYDSLQSCSQIHADASRQPWRNNGKNWIKSRHGS